MPIKEISISLENVPGKFSEVIDYLSEENEISIIALTVVNTADFNTVRIVINNTQKTTNILKSHGYLARVTEVLAVEAANHLGTLDAILKPLKELLVNINYLYSCLRTGGKTVLIVGVDKVDTATQVLMKNDVHIYDQDICKL